MMSQAGTNGFSVYVLWARRPPSSPLSRSLSLSGIASLHVLLLLLSSLFSQIHFSGASHSHLSQVVWWAIVQSNGMITWSGSIAWIWQTPSDSLTSIWMLYVVFCQYLSGDDVFPFFLASFLSVLFNCVFSILPYLVHPSFFPLTSHLATLSRTHIGRKSYFPPCCWKMEN